MTQGAIRDQTQTFDRGTIRVSQYADMFTRRPEPAQVSWASIGAVGIERAKEFAAALAEAIKLAETWNEDDANQEPQP